MKPKPPVIVILLLALSAMLAIPTRPALAAPIAGSLSAIIRPTQLVPGQAGYVFVGGAYPLEVQVLLDGSVQEVFWSGDGYMSLFAFGLDAPAGLHQIEVEADNPVTSDHLSLTETVSVRSYTYPLEQVALPVGLISLLDPDLNQRELDRLAAVYARRTKALDWDWPYALPVPGGLLTSRYGGDRTYNGGLLTGRHSGIDFRRAEGESVLATARGRVVLAEAFDVRGNLIVLDHGQGVFSSYAHLSELYVQAGDLVERGELIAAAGGTGRSNGPHLHFEVIVQGKAIDPLVWLSLSPWFVPPREVGPNTDENNGGP